jgi:hypothetical protein
MGCRGRCQRIAVAWQKDWSAGGDRLHDILASDTRAVIVGEVASKLKFNGKISETA